MGAIIMKLNTDDAHSATLEASNSRRGGCQCERNYRKLMFVHARNYLMIGILAGMGPKSTGPFVDQVIASFQSITGAQNDIDFPPMVIYSLPTPFYVDRPIDHSLMQKTICSGLKKLESWGASFIAMPCNSAHQYFDNLQKSISIPLLNMIDLTLDACPQSDKKITIMGTRTTLGSQLFQGGLNKIHCKYEVHPHWQEKIDAMILNVKSKTGLKSAVSIWEELTHSFLEADIDTIVLACTDLNVVLKDIHTQFRIIDASKCLSEAIVHKWLTFSPP